MKGLGKDENLIEGLIEGLRNTEKLIIVEGKKDKKALEKLGITNVKELNKSIFEFAEEIAAKEKEVIILTDLDKEGKLLYSKLKSNFQRNGVKVDVHFREFLFKNTKLRQIEGINSYIKRR